MSEKKVGVTNEQLGAFLETAIGNPRILGIGESEGQIFSSPKVNDFATSNGWDDFHFGGEHWDDYTSATKEAKASFLKDKFGEAVKNKWVRPHLTHWLDFAILDELYAIPPSSDTTRSDSVPREIETGYIASPAEVYTFVFERTYVRGLKKLGYDEDALEADMKKIFNNNPTFETALKVVRELTDNEKDSLLGESVCTVGDDKDTNFCKLQSTAFGFLGKYADDNKLTDTAFVKWLTEYCFIQNPPVG